MNNPCPCGSQKDMAQCCGQYLSGERRPATAEALMRSRYSAFVLKRMDYIIATTDPQTKLDFDFPETEKWMNQSEFVGLEVLHTEEAGNKGLVEFKAQFRSTAEPNAPLQTHHELSRFRRQSGEWFYRQGRISAPSKSAH